jgi:hypothetical protein
MISFMASGSFANMSATIGVLIVPGQTALMQIPLEAYSSAALFAIELFAADISEFDGWRLDAGVIERSIQAPKDRYSLLDHCCHLSLISDIASNGNRLVTGGDEFFCCRANRILIDVGQRHRRSRLREGFGCYQAHARASSGNERNFVLKR